MNKRSKINWNYLLIAPALIISVCVILVPGIMTVVYSFTDWNGLSPDINFIGLQNYQELFHDNVFFIAIKNNFIWAIMFLTIPVVIGMLSAMLLLSRKKTRSIYQVAFLIPYVLAPSVNAMLWLNIMFSPVVGVVAFLRNTFGWDISSPLASMKSAILPTVKLMFMMITIGSFLSFDYVKLLTGGGPAHSTEVLGTYAYSFAFSSMKVGKAASVGMFISIFGLIASMIYARMTKKESIE